MYFAERSRGPERFFCAVIILPININESYNKWIHDGTGDECVCARGGSGYNQDAREKKGKKLVWVIFPELKSVKIK